MTTLQRLVGDTVNSTLAAAVFLTTLIVYTVTMTPTVPFWDSGEYIATSYILGVPHPPGTPLYVLIGRIFTFLPFGSVAQQVNWFSALASAVTILFTYLVTVKISRRMFPWSGDAAEGDDQNRILGYAAGVTAALLAGFATTFWDNAVEAEVYAAACAIMTFCVWLILRWHERLGEGSEDGLLLVITYIVGLGVGIHLGVGIAAWAAAAFVFFVRPRYLFRWDYLGWLLVTVFSLGVGVQPFSFWVAPGVLAVTLVIYLLTGRLNKLALWSSILFMFGVSVHLYLMIRAGLDPAINEGQPDNWNALWLLLIRDQYKPGSPFDRDAPIWYQIDHMWLRYMGWNFTLFAVKGKAFFHLPILLAIAGAVAHMIKDMKTSVVLIVLFLFLGPAMVFYLNFNVGEVRERDYFFVQNFQFLAIWVGLGGAWLVDSFRRAAAGGVQRVITLTGALFLVAMSVLPVFHNWETHDRRGYTLARTYARNMLAGLEPDALIFTNGDNDTFPLWYIQEVEGFRKDVRVVNLSLLNTSWYIRQLRDLEPKVPIAWSDDQIRTIGEAMQFIYASSQSQPSVYEPMVRSAWETEELRTILEFMADIARRENRGVIIKDVAVDHILDTNAWRKPVYIAVSVPDHVGLDDRMKMEGLAFRVYPDPVQGRTDMAKLRENVHEVFSYEGFVRPDPDAPDGVIGVYDDTVFKGSGPSRMAQNNHAAAFSRMAVELLRTPGNEEQALTAIHNAEVIAPGFQGMAVAKGYVLEQTGRWEEAAEHYRREAEANAGNWQLWSRWGAALIQLDRPTEAAEAFLRARELAPEQYEPVHGLFTAYYEMNDPGRALQVLQDQLTRYPNDRRVRQLMGQVRGLLDEGGAQPDTGNGSD